MSNEYHKYVFDKKNRKFIGKFEEMYKHEGIEDFDSWYQEDFRDLAYPISLVILGQYNFDKILDIGCGKGTFTSYLKKMNNDVTGWDVSKTAVEKAKNKYKDILFEVVDAKKIKQIKEQYDIVVCKEILSYIKNWKTFINIISKNTEYFYVTLDLPTNPIGYVKTFDELKREIKKYFEIVVEIYIKTNHQVLILAQNEEMEKC